jgi:starch phosphorylase
MNEGHASLLTLELLDEKARKAGRESISKDDIEAVREKCVFTTHTPVPAGHDQFPLDLVKRVLEQSGIIFEVKDVFCCEGLLNMTYLALNLSRYINGVAKKHAEVSRLMFAGYTIDAITNGVHAATWISGPFENLYDRYIPGWRQDNFSFRYALSIPKEEIWGAHQEVKKRLINQVNRETGGEMDVGVLTIGFARRATTYKRGDLLFTDIERLKSISLKAGSFQIVYAGKAHPQDQAGKELIKRIFQAKAQLNPDVKIAYLENYDMEFGKMIASGVDLWLNTPQPPMEASGTSGMKAALNGVPSFSVLDGWWVEGHIEGMTGWSIGETRRDTEESNNWSKDASSIYNKLERIILPLFYRDRDRFVDVMQHCIALNGSFFNTHRMMQEYVLKAYFG